MVRERSDAIRLLGFYRWRGTKRCECNQDCRFGCHVRCIKFRHEKRAQTHTFGSGYFPEGVGVFHVKGQGGKKFDMSFETQKTQSFCRHIPGFLAGYPGGAWKVWEKKSLCSIFGLWKDGATRTVVLDVIFVTSKSPLHGIRLRMRHVLGCREDDRRQLHQASSASIRGA